MEDGAGSSDEEEDDEDLGRGSIVSVRSVHVSRADIDALLQLQQPTGPASSPSHFASPSSDRGAMAQLPPSEQQPVVASPAKPTSPPAMLTPPFTPPQLQLPDDDDEDDGPRQEQEVSLMALMVQAARLATGGGGGPWISGLGTGWTDRPCKLLTPLISLSY